MKSGNRAAILAAVCACSFGAARSSPAQLRSETGNPLMDYKLRTSRAEQTRREVRKAADEIVDLSSDLARRVAQGAALGPEDVKAVERIRKLAKRVRSDMGGMGEPQMENPPTTLRDAAEALAVRGERLSERIRKSSRFQMDARLIALAGEVMLLSDIVKQFRE